MVQTWFLVFDCLELLVKDAWLVVVGMDSVCGNKLGGPCVRVWSVGIGGICE